MTAAFRWAAIACCVVILLLTSAEIVLRLLGLRFLLSYEYCGFLLAALVFFALPGVTRNEEHITVVTLGPKSRFRRLRHLFVYALTAVYLLVLAYFTGLLTWSSYQDDARSMGIMLTPLYIPQAAMTLGIAAAALVLLLKARRRLRPSDPEESGR